MSKLTPKQEKFCQEYILTGNASEAYRTAYSTSKMKPETINVKASQFLSQDKIRVRIEELQAENKKRFEIDVDWKKQQLVDSIKHSKPLSVEELTELLTGAIDEHGNISLAVQQRLKQTSGTVVERAINQLNLMDGNHAAQKIEHSGKIDLAERLDRARERVNNGHNIPSLKKADLPV